MNGWKRMVIIKTKYVYGGDNMDELLTDLGQKVFKDLSKWSLLNKYYVCKKKYYAGKPSLSDGEFDNLELTITAIHGEDTLKTYGCVGYDITKHKLVISELKESQLKATSVHNKRYQSN